MFYVGGFLCMCCSERGGLNDYSFVRTKSQNFFGAMPQWQNLVIFQEQWLSNLILLLGSETYPPNKKQNKSL